MGRVCEVGFFGHAECLNVAVAQPRLPECERLFRVCLPLFSLTGLDFPVVRGPPQLWRLGRWRSRRLLILSRHGSLPHESRNQAT